MCCFAFSGVTNIPIEGRIPKHMLDLIAAYEKYLTKVKQASANTIASYMRDMRQFSNWLESQGVDVVDATQLNISDYLSHLESDGRSGATISRSLASLKNFYSYVVSSGFLEKTPVVDIHIEVVHGMNISAIAKSMVNKIRYTVEEATGLSVKKVNVFVDGIKGE